MTPTEASASAALTWSEEPAIGVHPVPSGLAPTDANLVTVIYKDLSVPSVTQSLASATVSRAYMLGSVTDVSLGFGAFPAASPASVMAMLKTVTQ